MKKTPAPPAHPAVPAKVRAALRREFSAFFTTMLTPEPGWPALSDEEFVDALADSVVDVGKRTGRGVAMLQTFVYELQERINDQLSIPKKKG